MTRPMMQSLGVSPETMAQDPRMMESMEALKKKAKVLEGEAILTVTSFAVSGTLPVMELSPRLQVGPNPSRPRRNRIRPSLWVRRLERH